MATITAYIDGFNLYYGLRARYGRRHHWLDVVEFVRQVRPGDQVEVVRYFTAIVKGQPDAAERQQSYLDALDAHNGALVDVRVGRFKDASPKPCGRCRRPYECGCPRVIQKWEEKETDVALGAMMVADAALGRGDLTLMISADTDLIPALQAVRLVDPNRRILVAFPPGNTAATTRRWSGIGSFHMSESALRAAQLPATVTATTGRTYIRPAKWS